jgi:uncharacterized protein (DUF302 family)
MLHVIESSRSVQDIEKSFPATAAKHKFGVLGVHNLKQKMNEKGVAFERECLVFEVCNPQKAKQVLESDMSISTALPCRVSVYEEGGRTKIATLKPTALIGLFGKPELTSVAEEVESSLMQIIKELA